MITQRTKTRTCAILAAGLCLTAQAQWCSTTDDLRRLPEGPAPRTVGPQTVFVALLQYPDEGPSYTRDTVVSSVTTMCNFFHDYSYGVTSLTPTITQTFLMMPHVRDYYAHSYDHISRDANQAALVNGYGDITTYNHIIYMFPYTHVFDGGWAGGGPQKIWLNNTADQWLMTHEMGHNYGIWHAGRWLPCDLNNPIDPCGVVKGYGDCHDIMGLGRNALGDWNPYEKYLAGWISATKINHVTASGVYRIHRFDSPQAGAFTHLAITIQQPGTSKMYWLAYRYSPTDLRTGVYLVWDDPTYQTRLIDYHSITTSCNGDTTLPVGATLQDHNLSITPIGLGGTAPNMWVDVQITF